MDNIKLIISVVSLMITIIGLMSGYFLIKFQTNQNVKDIEADRLNTKEAIERIEKEFNKELEKIAVDIKEMRLMDEKRTGDIYNLIRSSQKEIVDKLDEIKKEFVSLETCKVIRKEGH